MQHTQQKKQQKKQPIPPTKVGDKITEHVQGNELRVEFCLKHEYNILPKYQTSGSAGFDLHADVINDGVFDSETAASLYPGEMLKVATGLLVSHIPDGYELQVRPRSGLAAKHNITVLNAPGTIDSDYRGEIIVLLFNQGSQAFNITQGMRIAQCVLAPAPQATIAGVTLEVWGESKDGQVRGDGGFGSTGK